MEYDPKERRYGLGNSQYAEKLALRSASATKMKAIDFLLPGYLVNEKVNILAGEFGNGKSMMAAAMVAHITNGGSHPLWPDQTPTQAGNVLIISTEDEFDDTICPRLKAAGANLNRVAHIDGVVELNGDVRAFDFSAKKDIQILCDEVEYLEGISLLVIDPIGQVLSGNVRSNANSQILLEQLAKLAKRLHCAILGITHVSKTTKGKAPLSRIAGHQSITGAPRSVMLTAKMQFPPENGFDRILLQAKTSLCKTEGGFSYGIESVKLDGEDGPIETAKIVWGEPIFGDPIEFLQATESSKATDKQSAVGDAVAFLNEILASGPLLSTEIEKKAKALGISPSAISRARKMLGILTEKQKGGGQFSPFECSLPDDKSE